MSRYLCGSVSEESNARGEDILAQEAENEGVVEEDSEPGTTTQRNTASVRAGFTPHPRITYEEGMEQTKQHHNESRREPCVSGGRDGVELNMRRAGTCWNWDEMRLRPKNEKSANESMMT